MQHEPADPRLTYERKLVLEMVGQHKSILEVGAHDGHFTEFLISQGCQVAAVELSASAASLAMRLGGTVLCGNFEDPEFRAAIPGPFDVVLFMHVLEHFVDPWKALRATRELLRPGGSIIILVPNIACWRIRRNLLRGRFDYEDSGIMDRTHLRFFTMSSAMDLICDAGYRTLEWKPIDVYVPLESRMAKVSRAIARSWHRWMLSRFPNLCAEVLLFRIGP